MIDLIGIIIGTVLTLFIFSYLLGDNPLYKIAVHILVGVSAAYAGLVVVRQVLTPIYFEIQANTNDVNGLVWYVPLFFSFLLLLQRLPSIAWLSKITVAFMIGIGAAVSLVGAIAGTLWPQISLQGTDSFFLGQSVVAAVLTAVTLLSFQFTQRQRKNNLDDNSSSASSQLIATFGRVILTITFGYLFAAVLNTSLLIFTDRLGFFITVLGQIIGGNN